jgi:hypothetical protein
MSRDAAVIRILRALRTALGRKRCTFFDLPPDTFRSMRDPDEEEAEAWYRAHFRINGRPLP